MPFILQPNTISEGFTQSEISLLSDCGRKWDWQYNWRLTKKNSFSWALLVGTAWHTMMELMYATNGERWDVPIFQYPPGTILSSAQEADEKYWYAVLRAMGQAYCGYYKRDFEQWEITCSEEALTTNFQGFELRGKIDLVVRPSQKDGIYVVDHKSSSRLSPAIIAGWDFRFQFMFYLWLRARVYPDQKIKGFMINGVKKPEIRQKKGESLEEFAERLRLDMLLMRPDAYFYRDKLPMTKDAMDRFERDVLMPKIYRLQAIAGYDSPIVAEAIAGDMNTNHCQVYGTPCQYLDLCRHGESMLFLYEQRAVKHSELVEESI